jgi:hypothetical protein
MRREVEAGVLGGAIWGEDDQAVLLKLVEPFVHVEPAHMLHFCCKVIARLSAIDPEQQLLFHARQVTMMFVQLRLPCIGQCKYVTRTISWRDCWGRLRLIHTMAC